MATIKPRSKFIDTYWIISRNSDTPSCKISFTFNKRKTFNVIFKDKRLVWAGRKPVMESAI